MSYSSVQSRSAQTSRSRPGERPNGGNGSRSPMPSAPRGQSQSGRIPAESRTTGGGSFLDRMKAPSRTSLENDYNESPRRKDHRKASSRSKASPPDKYNEEEGPTEDGAPAAGHGYDIWSRVTTVASQLTVNVSQAWQKSIHLADGEETPPGEDSRLTKAMKAYHLAKARSPSDLPAWLFEEHERGVTSKTWRSQEPDEYEDRFLPDRQIATPKKSGLREVYDSVPRANGTSTSNSTLNGNGTGSRATDRLRAIREAKRSANQTGPREEQGERGPSRDEIPSSSSRRPPPRGGGLPSRPVRRG